MMSSSSGSGSAKTRHRSERFHNPLTGSVSRKATYSITRAFEAIASVFVVEQIVSGENVKHEIGRSLEAVIRRAWIGLFELTVIDLHKDARTEPRAFIQFDRRVDTTVQTG